MRRLVIAAQARNDLKDILRATTRQFGSAQRRAYEQLIGRAAELIAENPTRPGSRPRDDLWPGLRSFRVDLAASRRGAASHVLYYLDGDTASLADTIILVRILHDRMDPEQHFGEGTVLR